MVVLSEGCKWKVDRTSCAVPCEACAQRKLHCVPGALVWVLLLLEVCMMLLSKYTCKMDSIGLEVFRATLLPLARPFSYHQSQVVQAEHCAIP